MNTLHVMFPLDQSTLHVLVHYVCCVMFAMHVLLRYIIFQYVMFEMHEDFACYVFSGPKHAAHFDSPHLSQLQLIALQRFFNANCKMYLFKLQNVFKLLNVFVKISKWIC